jgi:hypothetical protein
MKEFYNTSRVLAHFIDLWDEDPISQEINFITYPFDSEREALDYTKQQINIWIANEGNLKFDTELELSYWEAL